MPILLGWLFLLMAIPIALGTAMHVHTKLSARAWPTVDAEIVSSALYQAHKPSQWCLQLAYRYQVAGRLHESRRTSSSRFAGTGCDRERHVIEARMARLQPGDRVRVRYDPDDPDTGVVYLADVEFIDYFLGALAALLFWGGAALIREGRRTRREQEAQRQASAAPVFR